MSGLILGHRVSESHRLHFHNTTQHNTKTMMEDDGLGLALARATELRFTIANCIHRATAAATIPPQRTDANHEGSSFTSPVPVNEEDDGETEEEEEEEAGEAEAEVLFNICDALESLETQLSSLQVSLYYLVHYL